ncbi:MAG: hypothetical protein HDS29_00270 [Bacteroides sp.]|nr:hypothetical protein [Bacteroides sp.]MBD5284698.1 hypothetical protein [Bacteroides sp.]
MSGNNDHGTYYYYGISTLLSSWIMSVGSLALILIASLFVDKLWLPAVVLVLEFLLLTQLSKERAANNGNCNILLYLTTRILLMMTLVMVAINLYYMKFIDPNEFLNGTANRRIPYITILVMGPVVCIMVIWAYFVRNRLSICRMCRSQYGDPSERGFLGRMFRTESRYQLRILFYIFGFTTIYTFWYYMVHYSNVNLNQADMVFYLYIPVSLIILSIIFLGRRYLKIFAFYRDNVIGDLNYERNITLLRFLIICDDRILMRSPDTDPDSLKVDTPVSVKLHHTEKISDFEVKKYFCRAADISATAVDVRYLYENVDRDMNSNIFHYLCRLENHAAINGTKLKGEWLTVYQVRGLYDAGMLSQLLRGEINRVYTVAMARKTYDKTGHRLYKVKHYTPSFKLKDLIALDVDYNDPDWLLVAKDNEDRPFFKLRRFIKKYFKGYEI